MNRKIRLALASLTVYHSLLEDPVIQTLTQLLDQIEQDDRPLTEELETYHRLIFHLAETGRSFKAHLLYLILHDDNPFSREAQRRDTTRINPTLLQLVQNDLFMLQKIYHLDLEAVRHRLSLKGAENPAFYDWDSLAGMEPASCYQSLNNSLDWPAEISTLAQYYQRYGSGLLSEYHAFRWEGIKKKLIGIKEADPTLLEDLVGYQSQKERLKKNTEQFLQGYPANNVLLYGSRGTGKSTMVKSLLNEYHSRGLRMVELAREDIGDLPTLTDLLRPHYALKFIIFIDDLSFEDYETQYKGLKALMEGSLQSRPDNLLLYATSNRRHLVSEFYSDRSGRPDEELHIYDSVQEKLSLAERFGLTITFPSPSQEDYLQIVSNLAQKRGFTIEPEILWRLALEWERSHHGPSGRVARQFVDSLGSGNLT